MESDWKLVEGPYLRDLLAQPQALRDTAAGLRDVEWSARLRSAWRGGGFERIVLTGMGSSLHALHPLHLRLVAAGHTPVSVETSELAVCQRELLTPRTLLLVVSQSGASAETVRLMGDIPPGCFLLGLTNTPESPLARGAAELVLLRAGPEWTVSCKTYLASLAALHWLGALLTEQESQAALAEVEQCAAGAERYLARWREHVAAWRPWTEGIKAVYVTGRGASLAAAWEAGLTLKETTYVPSEGLSSAAFRHGPFELCAPSTLLVVLEGIPAVAPLNRRLAEDAAQAGARTVRVGLDAEAPTFRVPPVPGAVLPLVETLPLQMLSLALAAREGREAGHFRHCGKVTTVE